MKDQEKSQAKESFSSFSEEQLENWFTYHEADVEEVTRYVEIRKYGRMFAECINRVCPASADKSDAMRKIREAVMTANASIACKGK